MRLDSAIALKEEMKIELEDVMEDRVSAEILSVPAGPIDRPRGRGTVALGIAPQGGGDHHLAVRLQERNLESSELVARIESRAAGEVDVRYIGEVRKLASGLPVLTDELRPLIIGCSIGHFRITAGSLGAIVIDRQSGDPMVLSNNHVLADENRGRQGDAILQPGDRDGGMNPDSIVAELASFLELSLIDANFFDAAVAVLDSQTGFDQATLHGLPDIAALRGLRPQLEDNIPVAKVGKTTAATRGRVTAFGVDNLRVDFDISELCFDDQVEIEGDGARPFSQGGDSGSLVVDFDGLGLGLLFAGSDAQHSSGTGLSYANPLPALLEELKVDLLF